MNKQEFFFPGALFFSVCAFSSNQWPGYTAAICIICALLAGVFLWRGIVLFSAAKSAEKAALQEKFWTDWDERWKSLQKNHEILQRMLEALEPAIQAQEQTLSVGLNAVEQAVRQESSAILNRMDAAAVDGAKARELLEQHHKDSQAVREAIAAAEAELVNSLKGAETELSRCVGSVVGTIAEQTEAWQRGIDRLAAESNTLCEKIMEQHTERESHLDALAEKNTSDLLAMFNVIADMEQLIKGFLAEFDESISNAGSYPLSGLQRKLLQSLDQIKQYIREGNEQSEDHLDDLKELLGKEGERQRSWMDEVMQKYESITEQDLEALRAVMGDSLG